MSHHQVEAAEPSLCETCAELLCWFSAQPHAISITRALVTLVLPSQRAATLGIAFVIDGEQDQIAWILRGDGQVFSLSRQLPPENAM